VHQVLEDAGVCGELNFNFFDEKCNLVTNDPIKSFGKISFGIGLKDISKMAASNKKYVIASAHGIEKAPAIRAAINNMDKQLCNVLIIPEDIAEILIEMKERPDTYGHKSK